MIARNELCWTGSKYPENKGFLRDEKFDIVL